MFATTPQGHHQFDFMVEVWVARGYSPPPRRPADQRIPGLKEESSGSRPWPDRAPPFHGRAQHNCGRRRKYGAPENVQVASGIGK